MLHVGFPLSRKVFAKKPRNRETVGGWWLVVCKVEKKQGTRDGKINSCTAWQSGSGHPSFPSTLFHHTLPLTGSATGAGVASVQQISADVTSIWNVHVMVLCEACCKMERCCVKPAVKMERCCVKPAVKMERLKRLKCCQ